MKYAKARELITDGDLVFWSHYDWGTWYDLQVQAVRIGTRSEFCHVGVAHLHGGRVWIIEAVKPVVRMVPLSNLLKDGAFFVNVNKPIGGDELEFLLSTIGRGEYSTKQAIQGQIETLDIGQDDEWQCAELAITARKKSGLDLGCKATPSEVWHAALQYGPMHAIDKEAD